MLLRETNHLSTETGEYYGRMPPLLKPRRWRNCPVCLLYMEGSNSTT